ncbi:hypothetical protein Q5752_006282 [Cryptotrichosporon argae]
METCMYQNLFEAAFINSAAAASASASTSGTPALAIARTGGAGGQVYVYSDADAAPASFSGSSPVDIVGGSSRKVRESLTSYLIPFSQSTPLSPPSSLPAASVAIPPRAHHPSVAYPLSPASSVSFNAGTPSLASTSVSSHAPSVEVPHALGAPDNDNAAIVPLISSVFPYHAAHVASAAHMLEIVTPPDHVLRGFVVDSDALGRTAFVHLPPTHASAPLRPERLTPHFSTVLRPHDPAQAHPSHEPQPSGFALDIRDSLTALLDLAADCLDAAHLVLILDKDEREPERLDDLLHALMYVGGQPVRPGAAIGEWEWNARQWMLVSIEL